jgi:DNA polymerase III epsilon subunit-like protein
MIFIDTETTGLLEPEANDLNKQPYIIELYMVKLERVGYDFNFVSEFESFFLPPIPLPEFITKITNITPQMLEGAPSFSSKYEELCSFFLGEDTIVGHNLAFDAGMLWTELARIQCDTKFPWPYKHHCTVELSLGVEHHRLKLDKLYELATGHERTGQHRARKDVEDLVTSYKWLLEEGYIH